MREANSSSDWDGTRVKYYTENSFNLVERHVPIVNGHDLMMRAAYVIAAYVWTEEQYVPGPDWKPRHWYVAQGLKANIDRPGQWLSEMQQKVNALQPTPDRKYAKQIIDGCVNEFADWRRAMTVACVTLEREVDAAGGMPQAKRKWF